MEKNYLTKRFALIGKALLSCLFIVSLSNNISAQTPPYYSSNVSTSACNNFPFNTATTSKRVQWLYRPGEFIGAPAGQAITSIWLKPCTGVTQTYTLIIKLGHSNLTGFTAGSYITAGMVTVYSATVTLSSTVNGWMEFPLQTPFNYNPSQSLILDVDNVNALTGFSLNHITPGGGNCRLYAAGGSSDGGQAAAGVTLKSLGPNNAGVNRVTEPVNFCPGTYPVKVEIQNSGTNKLDSVRINWMIDGVFKGTIYRTTALDTAGHTNGNKAIITLGTETFNAGITRNLKVWTSHPNGVADTVQTDDTINVAMRPALSGVFTIGASGANYTSFTTAVSDLVAYGVCGPVEFRVAAGTYTNRVEIKQIPGASSTNTVRFIGANKTTTILTNAGTSTANFVTLMFDGADFVEFRDMTIRGTGATFGIGVMFTGKADSNALRNVVVTVSNSATATTVTGITWSSSKTAATGAGDNGNYNHLDSLTITGGYYGIRMDGISTTVACYGNKVTNSSVTSAYYSNAYILNQSHLILNNNVFNNPRYTTTSYGLYGSYVSNCQVTNNDIRGNYGINFPSINSSGYNSSVVTTIANNRIVANTDYGFYTTGGGEYRFVHNSVNANTNYAAYITAGSNITLMNNHIRNFNTAANSMALNTSAGFDSLNYNNYWSLGASGSIMSYGGTAYSDFASYKADLNALGFEKNSYNQEPGFVSNTDLRIDQSVINLRGIFAGVYYDRDGDERCEFAPTLGSDESFFQTPSPDAKIALNDSVYVSSPTTFYSAFQPLAGVRLDYTWYVDNVFKFSQQNYTTTFPSTGTYEVKLRVRSCMGSDRDSVMVNVINPTSTPVTDFTASKLVVNVLEASQLSDLSDFGPTQWTWTADPSAGVIFSNAFAANPTVSFIDPGEYKICLTTANALGQGNTLCKTAYISVNDDKTFCSANQSTFPAGRITDEGGPAGNYTASANCNFLIQPCAGQVTLRFTQWALSDGDDELRVYDGTDNTGTLLGTFDGNSNIPGGVNGLVANTGKMYLEWSTSPGGQTAGFTAYWTSAPDPNALAPVADFSMPDSVFVDQVITFTSTSTGDALRYAWDFDPPFQLDGFEGGDQHFDRYMWPVTGTYPVQLTVSNCGGTHDIIKQVVVMAPTTVPVVGFYADRVKVPVLTTVTLFDSSFQGGTAWKWKITPSVTTNMLTPDNQQELKVSFIKSGKYTVQLKVTNSLGSDSLIKTDYIEVFDYCAPVVGNLSSDVAISRVKLRTIDNYSSVGVNKYNNYLNDFAAEVLPLRDSMEITIERLSTIDPLNRKVWVDWNNDGDFDDAGEEVLSQSASTSQSYTGSITVPNNAMLGYTTLRVGVSYNQDPNKPCGINQTGEFEDYPVRIIVDQQKPVITLKGLDTIWVEQSHLYTDAGATAFDNIDGDLTPVMNTSNTVDTSVAGTYYVRYNVSDIDGNIATEVVRVVVVTPDVTAPVITLIGAAVIDVTVGTSYSDGGATAEDYFQVDLTPQMVFGDNIDLSTLGTYYYWYVVEDAAGNRDSVARQVNVVDNIAPILTLTGNNPLVVEVKTAINDPGYSVSDNHYPFVFVNVDSSMVNINSIGTYTMTYKAIDGSGNQTILDRTVLVQDNTAPVLTIIGNDTVTVDVHSSYNEQGVQLKDNYCQGLNWEVDQQPNTSVIGDYLLSYTATDCFGNISAPLTRLVRVVDRTAPVLELNGFAANTIYRWQGYTDPGVSITDNYYSETILQPLVSINSNFDPNWVGFYSICYTVTDPSNNTSNTVCRSVEVLESISSVGEIKGASVKAYPNPGNGLVNLEGDLLKGNETILVLDVQGREIFRVQNTSPEKTQLDLRSLSAGLYVISIENTQYVETLKIQISK